MKTTRAGGNRIAPSRNDPDSQGLANTKIIAASRVAAAAKYLRRTGIKRTGIKMRVAGNLDWPARIDYAIGCGFDRIVFSIQTLRRGLAMPAVAAGGIRNAEWPARICKRSAEILRGTRDRGGTEIPGVADGHAERAKAAPHLRI